MVAVSDLGVIAFMFEMLDEEEEAMEIELKYLTSYSIFSEPIVDIRKIGYSSSRRLFHNIVDIRKMGYSS